MSEGKMENRGFRVWEEEIGRGHCLVGDEEGNEETQRDRVLIDNATAFAFVKPSPSNLYFLTSKHWRGLRGSKSISKGWVGNAWQN